MRKEVRGFLIKHGFPEALVEEIDKPSNRSEWSDLCELRMQANKAHNKIMRVEIRGDDPVAVVERDVQAEAEAILGDISIAVHRELDTRDKLGNRGPRNLTSGKAGAVKDLDENDVRDGLVFRDMHSGHVIRAVRHGESIRKADSRIERPGASLGEFLRSVAIGRPTMPELESEVRTLITTTTGMPIPTPFAAQLIDLAREQSMASQAGVLFVPMDSKTLQMAKITADPTVAWKAEGSAFTASDPTLTTVTLTAKTAGVLVIASEEAAMDAPDFGVKMEQLLKAAVGAELDRVILVGSGSGAEPQGIYGGTDVQTLNVGGTPTNYGFISQLVQKVRTANHIPNACFMHPRTYGTLDRLTDTTGQTIAPPKSFNDLQHFQSTRIPINIENGASPNDGTIAIVGKFSECLVGVRLNPVLHVSRETTDGTDHAFTKYQLHFRVVMRMDVQMARGAAFAVGLAIND